MQEVLLNRLGGLSLPRKSVSRLTDRPDMTLDVYRGRKATTWAVGSDSATSSSIITTLIYMQFSLIIKVQYAKRQNGHSKAL